MSGQEKFSRRIEETLDGIRIVQTVHAKILNMNDPDVRYACGTGPLSAGPDYAEVLKRGRAKAETSFRGMPESLTAEAKSWAKALAPFSGTTLHVEIDGRYDDGREMTGRAALAKDGPHFHFTPAGVFASLEEPGPDGQLFGISANLRLSALERVGLDKWVAQARKQLTEAQAHAVKIAELGVTVHQED